MQSGDETSSALPKTIKMCILARFFSLLFQLYKIYEHPPNFKTRLFVPGVLVISEAVAVYQPILYLISFQNCGMSMVQVNITPHTKKTYTELK